MFQETKQGICFKVKVILKASSSEIVEWEGEELKIRLAAVPQKGEANQELIRLLAKVFALSPSKIELLYGKTSRHKCICIKNLSLKEIQERLTKFI